MELTKRPSSSSMVRYSLAVKGVEMMIIMNNQGDSRQIPKVARVGWAKEDAGLLHTKDYEVQVDFLFHVSAIGINLPLASVKDNILTRASQILLCI